MEEPTDHPQFFMVILQPHQFHQLSIPNKFVSDYGDLLSNGRSYLRIHATTVRWSVQLIKNKGEAHFTSGWLEFCSRFSLSIGNFVVFEYVGDNNFDVVIFNTSGDEIDYQRYLDRVDEVEIDYIDLSSDHLLESSDDDQENTIDKNDEFFDADENGKKSLSALGEEKKKCWSVPEPGSEEGVTNTVGKARRGRPVTCSTVNKRGKVIPKAVGDDSMTIPSVVSMDFIGPKTFKIKMQPSYLAQNSTVNVPVKHARAFLVNDNSNATIKLTIKNPTGGTAHSRKDIIHSIWSVYYYVDIRNYTHLSRGWYEFIVDNSIREQDECLFEMIDVECKMYGVSILRWEKDKDCIKEKEVAAAAANKVKQRSRLDPAPASVSCSSGSGSRLRKEISYNKEFHKAMNEWANHLGIKHPYFSVLMKPSYVNPANCMHIPSFHSEVYMNGEYDGHITLSVKNVDKTWHVKCLVNKASGRTRFGAKWSAFVYDNSIVAGDACLFELVNPSVMLYRVTIRRRLGDWRPHNKA